MTDLEQLRREHADSVIGPELQRLLERVVRATAPAYPPTEYSDSGAWDAESLADALQDWVEARLLRRGDLSKMLLKVPSVPALRGALTRSFEQFLINRRRRTSATNLYQRTTKMLRDESDRFARVGRAQRSHGQLWTLTENAATVTAPSPLPVPSLVGIASELSDDDLKVVRYGPTSLKSSPILREPHLREFLVHLLGRAEGALDQTTIAEVMRRRFGLFDLAEVALEDHEVAAPPVELRQAEHDVVVTSVRARLGGERLQELRAFHAADGDADELPPAVSDTIALVAQYAESAEAAEEIYDRLVESLF